MKVSVKKLKDLERKITISVPVEDYEIKFNSKIKNIKTKAKIDGFRKGNVPNDVLEQRYGQSIHADVVNELIQESYPKAITENKVRPASSPKVTIDSEDPKKPLTYSAIIEVFPEIKPKFSNLTLLPIKPPPTYTSSSSAILCPAFREIPNFWFCLSFFGHCPVCMVTLLSCIPLKKYICEISFVSTAA